MWRGWQITFNFPTLHCDLFDIVNYSIIWPGYKVKQFLYKPGQVPGGWGTQISRQSEYEGRKVVSFTHRPPLPPPPGDIPGTHFTSRLSHLQCHSAAGRNNSMKNSRDSIGNPTRDLPACSAVPQRTAPRRVGQGASYVFFCDVLYDCVC